VRERKVVMGFAGLVFVVLLLSILFGITSMAVGGFFFVRFVGSYLQGGPFLAAQKRVLAAIQATNLGWLALACGPLLGLFIALISLPITLPLSLRGSDHDRSLFVEMLRVMPGVGVVAGVIAGGAFWVSSALLGRVRKAAKRRGGAWDPDLDGLP
jgi:hypothetical protein